jgi:hypothetical protein
MFLLVGGLLRLAYREQNRTFRPQIVVIIIWSLAGSLAGS